MNNSVSERLDVWYQREPGKSLGLAEQQTMAGLVRRLFGYYLLQIGGSNVIDLVSASPVLNKVQFDEEMSAAFRGLQVRGQFSELPFLPKSFDVILLPHTLEFVEEPIHLLQEVYELLIPGGHVVILGFNPFSLWGVMQRWKTQELLFPAKLIRFGQLQGWLNRFGLQVESYNAMFFRPPFLNANQLQRTLFLEGVGQLCWPSYGAVYIVVAQKVESAVTMTLPFRGTEHLAAAKDAQAELGARSWGKM